MSDENKASFNPEEIGELLDEFLNESENHLEIINAKLLEAECATKEGVAVDGKELDAMFRSAHTIKGSASFIGLIKTVALTHEAETILQKVKNSEMSLTVEVIDVLFKAFDTVESLFSNLRKERQELTDIDESMELIKKVLSNPEDEMESGPEKVEKKEVQSDEEYQSASDISLKYLSQFIFDLDQNIEECNQKLLTLEEDQSQLTLINDLFRIMHTIKGSAGVVGILELQSLAHGLENILGVCREEKKMCEEVFTFLYKGVDVLTSIKDSLTKEQRVTIDVSEMCEELDQYYLKISKNEDDGQAKEVIKPDNTTLQDIKKRLEIMNLSEEHRNCYIRLINEGLSVYEIYIDIDKTIAMKSLKVMLVEEYLKANGDIILIEPVLDEAEAEKEEDLIIGLLYATKSKASQVQSLICVDGVNLLSVNEADEFQKDKSQKDLSQGEPNKGNEMNPEQSKSEEVKQEKVGQSKTKNEAVESTTMRIDSKKLDNLMNLSGELVIIRAQFSRLVNIFNKSVNEHKELLWSINEIRNRHDSFSSIVKNRLSENQGQESEKLNEEFSSFHSHFDRIQQMAAQDSIINYIHELDETTGALEKVSSDIQSGVMQTRMIPIEGVFTRFKRIVRDIAKEIKKEINLHIDGEDTEIDKKIVDSLSDPLTHMVRNACDHGIEEPKVRESLGKSPSGNVFLRAVHKGNNICIKVGDDGKGLSPDGLAQSALKKGLITEDQVDRLTDKEKLHLMFLPGFSTAAQVTGLSGRGVGMDVVKNMISTVNGTVDIDTELNKGTTITLKIPLTLAIIQALLVVVGGETYALPLENVTEIVKTKKDDIYSIDGNVTVKLREHALGLIELEQAIGIDKVHRNGHECKRVVVVTDGSNQLGVIVDTLIGEEEIVIKSLPEHFSGVRGITGVSILGDGTIALILDPLSIIHAVQ